MSTPTMDGRPPSGVDRDAGARAGRSDRSPWLYLLIIPVLLPLLPMIYNFRKPTFIGMPFFYWFQLLLVFVSAGITGLVYVRTRSRRNGDGTDEKGR